MLKMLRGCLDWRLLGAVAVVPAGLAVVAPNLPWAAVPLLLIGAYPLVLVSMGMGGIATARRRARAQR